MNFRNRSLEVHRYHKTAYWKPRSKEVEEGVASKSDDVKYDSQENAKTVFL